MSGVLKYRADIDGLRAVAVIGVVLFHAGLPGFSGGFAGVDVFFVISGFLITSIIVGDFDQGRFSLARFYERRARRLLPALVFLLLVLLVVGWLVLLPHQYEALGESIAATSVYASNFYFWLMSGYFAPQSHELPLLHTWSLAVEEQFYAVWPLLLLILLKRPRQSVVFWIGGLLVATFVLSVLSVRFEPRAAFYLPIGRGWELALGAWLAVARPAARTPGVSTTLSVLGLGSILASFMLYSASTPFPGMAASLPCVGTALVICAGQRATFVTRALTWKGLVAVGLVSYSWYLWHWPLLVLPAIYYGRPLNPAETTVSVFVSLCLSVASWRFVERPFRRGSRRGRRWVFVGASLVTLMGFTVGVLLWMTHGVPSRLGATAGKSYEATRRRNPLQRRCNVDGDSRGLPDREGCILGAGGREGQSYPVLLWGDSHADHFAPAVASAGEELGFSTRQLSRSACAPLLGVKKEFSDGRVDSLCAEFNEMVLATIVDEPGIRLVVLGANWSAYRGRATREPRKQFWLVDSETTAPSRQDSQRVFEEALRRTVSRLRREGKAVLLLGQVPPFKWSPGECVVRALWRNRAPSCDQPADRVLAVVGPDDDLLRSLSMADGVEAVILTHLLCDSSVCRTSLDGAPLYYDRGHLNAVGSRLVGRRISPRIWDPALSTGYSNWDRDAQQSRRVNQ